MSNQKKIPFLYTFRQPIPVIEEGEDVISELDYDEERQLNLVDGEIAWSARRRRPATSCHTKGRRRKGYRSKHTKKWLPSKWIPSRRDRRAGR